MNRCEYTVGSVRCCEPKDHDGPHMFKCAGKYCQGLPWVASNTPHPTTCDIDFRSIKRVVG